MKVFKIFFPLAFLFLFINTGNAKVKPKPSLILPAFLLQSKNGVNTLTECDVPGLSSYYTLNKNGTTTLHISWNAPGYSGLWGYELGYIDSYNNFNYITSGATGSNSITFTGNFCSLNLFFDIYSTNRPTGNSSCDEYHTFYDGYPLNYNPYCSFSEHE